MVKRTDKLAVLLWVPFFIWKGLDLYGNAQTAADLFDYAKVGTFHLDPNWPFVYRCMALGSFIWLLCSHWKEFSSWVLYIFFPIEHAWNMTVPEAINWIAVCSHQGKSFEQSIRYKLAASALKEKAAQGALTLGGVSGGIYNQIPIPKRDVKKFNLYCLYAGVGGASHKNNGEAKDAALIDSDNMLGMGKDQLKWAALMVDKRQLQKIWSSNVGGYG